MRCCSVHRVFSCFYVLFYVYTCWCNIGINAKYIHYIKDLCCLEIQYCPSTSDREINKYEYFFTYSAYG